MTLYLIEMYERFHIVFLLGWFVWAFLTLVGGMICTYELDDNPHQGTIRYYFILTVLSLFTIGVLGSIFLPSPDLFLKFLK